MCILGVSHHCMAITFIKLLQNMLISHAKINKSMITKFGIFANYRSLSKTQCSLAFEKLPKLLWYRNLFAFHSMFFQHH